ncbi:hypothetical protein, partial [Thiolapillus sp.]|uniref:hypothetical protein n=1 Tax=Thiolapillus sp. TaxID=2017437 RepID=UPI0025DE370D
DNLKFPRNYSSHHAQQHSDQRISGGIAGFGANPGKILIQSSFGDNASNIGKGKTGTSFHFMPAVPDLPSTDPHRSRSA